MNYYGTSLENRGHYMWELEGTQMFNSRLKFDTCPFNPEALPYQVYQNGEVRHYQFCGFTILAICGSCNDDRTGSKSIFFIRGDFTDKEMKEKILSIPIGKKIIEKMTFEVRW